MRDIERGELRAPAWVIDIDLAHDYGQHTVDTARYATAWCLVRAHGAPVAIRFLDIDTDSSIALECLREHFAALAAAQPVEPVAPTAGLQATLTVVICTRDRPEGLAQTLASLARQTDPDFTVLVVDNSDEGTLARTLSDVNGLDLRCCHEPIPGLSRARNRALNEVDTELIAWIDDDEVADPDWIAWIKQGFTHPHHPDAVTGLMLPAELETDAQVNFERYGGFNKGRDIEPVALQAGTPTVFDPLYPLPSFGAGGNMAFRTHTLRTIGGFDNRLGAGTLTHGGEETRALSQLLEHGSTILYWPPAITWHYHRRTDDALQKQFFGYSAGLTAFYMSMILTSPTYLWRIIKLVPRGIKRILTNHGTGQPDAPTGGIPHHLLRAGRQGLLQGAWLYLRETRHQHHTHPTHKVPA